MEETVSGFGSIHRAIHGDGWNVLRRVLGTLEQVLNDRGYSRVERFSDENIRAHPPEPIMVGNGPDGMVRVFLCGDDRVSVKYARAVLETGEGSTIILSAEGPTPFTRKELSGTSIRFMQFHSLCNNKTRHTLVPQHERVDRPPDGICCHNLPRYLESDPIVQHYNWPVGTILRIWRNYGGHEPIPYYRIVVAA